MTTEEFVSFCKEQQREIDALRLDLHRIHESRHAAQEGISSVISEMRVDHNDLQKTVALLADSIKELIIAMKGSYGGQGLVTLVSDLKERTASLEDSRLAASANLAGAKWVIVSAAAAGGVVASAVNWLLHRSAP